jgi:hypothetical protein
VVLVNAAHVKQLRGRQADKHETRWLAKLMRDGLLQASFIQQTLQAGRRSSPALLLRRGQILLARARGQSARLMAVARAATLSPSAVPCGPSLPRDGPYCHHGPPRRDGPRMPRSL